MFPPSGEGRETPTVLFPLETPDQLLILALSKGPSRVGVFPLLLKMETDPVSELCFLVIYNSVLCTKPTDLVIPSRTMSVCIVGEYVYEMSVGKPK
jgi:hypothetical protein